MTSKFQKRVKRYQVYRSWSLRRAEQAGQLYQVTQALRAHRKKHLHDNGGRAYGAKQYYSMKKVFDTFSFCRYADFVAYYDEKKETFKKASVLARKARITDIVRRAITKIKINSRLSEIRKEKRERNSRTRKLNAIERELMSREDRLKKLQKLNVICNTREQVFSKRVKADVAIEKEKSDSIKNLQRSRADAIKKAAEAASKIVDAREKEAKLLAKIDKEEDKSPPPVPTSRRRKKRKTGVMDDISWVYNNYYKIFCTDERKHVVIDEVFLATEAPSDGAMLMANLALEIGLTSFCSQYVSKILAKEKIAIETPKETTTIVTKDKDTGEAVVETVEKQEENVDQDPDVDDIIGYMK